MIYIIKLHRIKDPAALVAARPNWYEVDRFESDQVFQKKEILYVRSTYFKHNPVKCYGVDKIGHEIELRPRPDGMDARKVHNVTILYCYVSDQGVQDPDYQIEEDVD